MTYLIGIVSLFLVVGVLGLVIIDDLFGAEEDARTK